MVEDDRRRGAALCRCKRTASDDFEWPQQRAQRGESKFGVRILPPRANYGFLRNTYASELIDADTHRAFLNEHRRKNGNT